MSSKATRPILKRSASTSDASPPPTAKQAKEKSDKMHRRSRSGCFTCRLRRKKCDESKPACRACRHLGLQCEYKRPGWWSNNEQRKQQKEDIKNIIKTTKLVEKPAPFTSFPGTSTPPGLCYSLPTSSTHSEYIPGSRPTIHSPFSPPFSHAHTPDYFNSTPMPPPGWTPINPHFPHFSPFEVDVKTERQVFVNDVPTRKDSTISTFSTFHPPPSAPGTIQTFPIDGWVHQEYFESQSESFSEEPLDFNFFDFPHDRVTPSHQTVIQVDDCDRPLLDHFFNKVIPLVFPILEANQHGSALSNVILPALETNKCYLHCCLSASAVHMKATEKVNNAQIDDDIMRHRGATIATLCEALNSDTQHPQMLEATLAMIFFQANVGLPDEGLPDIAWHQHYQAAADIVARLDLTQHIGQKANNVHTPPPFDMSLAAWIDILGATMMGRVPLFADIYRERGLPGASFGLAELMGCEDRVMYIISEIACLESIKSDGSDDLSVCNMIKTLGEQLSINDPGLTSVGDVYTIGSGAIRPRQLSKNMTAIFRLAARIYLCSLVPNFDRYDSSVRNLIDALTEVMQFIPGGPGGFDRSLVWPLLIAGSVSVESSKFRTMFQQRCEDLGETAKFGSFGKVAELLGDVWAIHDGLVAQGEMKSVHWRDVMQHKGWDFLLI